MTGRAILASRPRRCATAARRGPRRALAVAAGAIVLGTVLAPLGGPQLAEGQRTTSATPRSATQVAATGELTLLFQPVTVGPNDPFPVLLEVEGASTATEIAVDIYDRVAPDEPVGPVPERDPLATFPVVPIAGSADDPTTPRTTGFTIELTDGSKPIDPSWGYRLDAPGVYPVRVRLRGPEGDTGVVLMTAIVRLPAEGEPTPSTEVALVVPVHRPPQEAPDLPSEQGDDEAEDADARPPFDPELADDLRAVLEVLAEHPDLPVTFSVTPETLQALAADADRAELLAALRAAVEGADRQLLDAPYVAVDPAELVAGELTAELPPQISAGRQALTQLLEPPSTATWQLTQRLTPDAADQLSQLGITSALLPSGAIEGGAGRRRPVSLGSGPGPLRALSFDAALALESTTGDPLLAGNRAVARLAAVAAEQPARVAIAVDPDTVDPAALEVLLGALDAQGALLAARTVDDVLATSPDPMAATLAAPTSSDLGGYPEALALARSRLAAYAAMVGDRTDLIAPYEARLLRSAAHELPVAERTADADAVVAALDEPFDAIRVPEADQITLGARDARFPLPITSELDHPVNVVIELESNDRLEFPRNRVQQTLQPGRQIVELAVRTRAPGATPVRITVRSPDDAVVLAESRYTIRSTAVSGVGVLLTVGAALVLAGWWFRHWRRNRGTARHARRRGRRPDPSHDAPGAPTSNDADPAGPEPTDPPSDDRHPSGAPAAAGADATDV